MLKCLFLIAVTAPILVSCQTNSTDETKSNNFTCLQSNEVQVAGLAFLNILRKGITDTLTTNSIDRLNETIIPTSNEFLSVFLACKNKTLTSESYAKIIKFLEFSLKDQKYKNFTTTGGITCINGSWSNIGQCINRTIGYVNYTEPNEYGKLFRKAELRYTKTSCILTKSLSKCTEKALKNNTNCIENHVAFVNSLFNFFLETTPCANMTYDDFRPPSIQNSASSALFNSAVILVSFLYMLH